MRFIKRQSSNDKSPIRSKGIIYNINDEVIIKILGKMVKICNKLIVWSHCGSIEQELRMEGTESASPLIRHPVDTVKIISGFFNIVYRVNQDCYIVAEPKVNNA